MQTSQYCCLSYRAVALNLGSIEAQGFGESVSGDRQFCSSNTVIVCVDDARYSFCTNTVYSYNLCLEFEAKRHIFSNYEGHGEFMYRTCGIRYLQKG